MTEEPFGGLFRTDNYKHGPRSFEGGFRWSFPAPDLRESAKSMFRQLDRTFEILTTTGFVFLSTIELDAEPGRFPDVLLQYFRDDERTDGQSFFVAPIRRTHSEPGYPVGRLTFEANPGQTRRALSQNDGFRWGAGLRVWGLQVAESDIAGAIEMSLDDADQVATTHRVARAAWFADQDLDVLTVWVSPSVDAETRARLEAARRANPWPLAPSP